MAEAKKATEQKSVLNVEHPKSYALVRNVTPAGLHQDAHQALVAASRLFVSEESAYHLVKNVLDNNKDLPAEVRSHLESVVSELEGKAHIAEATRSLLEKYV